MNHEANQPLDPSNELDALLIELRLGKLNPAQQRDLDTRLASDSSLADRDASLRDALRALDTYRVAVPADLAERTLARVRRHAATGTTPSTPRIAWPAEDERIIRFHSVREIAAVAAMIVLAVGIGVPGLVQMRDRAQRTACSWNLGQVGRGMQTYATAFADSLPFVGFNRQSSWQPTREPGIVHVPNRQHLYPLLVTGNVPEPSWLICPSGSGVPMSPALVKSKAGFVEASNISYATQNMAGVRPSVRNLPNMPLIADDNPIFDDGVPSFDLAARTLGLSDPSQSNSAAHRFAGQNVLSADGTVRWTTTPLAGVHGDNIWTLQGAQRYTGREGPATATDSHLLK